MPVVTNHLHTEEMKAKARIAQAAYQARVQAMSPIERAEERLAIAKRRTERLEQRAQRQRDLAEKKAKQALDAATRQPHGMAAVYARLTKVENALSKIQRDLGIVP